MPHGGTQGDTGGDYNAGNNNLLHFITSFENN